MPTIQQIVPIYIKLRQITTNYDKLQQKHQYKNIIFVKGFKKKMN